MPLVYHQRFTISNDYHFGGYAKYNTVLLEYMNEVWKLHLLPLDFVYTAKTLYGTEAMIRNKTIPQGSHILMVHTGGLQGNLSLPSGHFGFSINATMLYLPHLISGRRNV